VEKILTENLGTGRWREDKEIRGWFGDWIIGWRHV
jgi:hypothetical protein